MRTGLRYARTRDYGSRVVGGEFRWLDEGAPTRAPPVEYRFGRFTVQPTERRLLGDEGVLAMAPRTFDLLVFFVANAGHLVSKDALLASVWSGVVVEEANVHVQVCALRRVVGQPAIETVPRHGYRFCPAVLTCGFRDIPG